MSYLFKQEEIGDYRISIYQDEDAECPCTAWDLTGVYLWDYTDRGSNRELSSVCNYEELFGSYGGKSEEDALKALVCKYVPEKKIIDYIRSKNVNDARLRYDKRDHLWYLETLFYEEWLEEHNFTPKELRDYDNREELCDVLEENDYKSILYDCKDIAFYEWSTSGYCQGDYVEGFAYCDKERFSKMYDADTKNWRKRALEKFEDEVKSIGLWMWGDVKGYVLEKKVPYKKVFTEIGRESVDGYDWEEIDSCWGEFYKDADELIEEVLREKGIQREDAA